MTWLLIRCVSCLGEFGDVHTFIEHRPCSSSGPYRRAAGFTASTDDQPGGVPPPSPRPAHS